MCHAFEVTPTLTQYPTIITTSASRLISFHVLDWISPSILQLFLQTLIMDLLTHSSLLYTYTSQMFPHADAHYDHLNIYVYCYYAYNIIIINVSSCPIATEFPSFTISQLSVAVQPYFILGLSATTRKVYQPAFANTSHSVWRLTNHLQ